MITISYTLPKNKILFKQGQVKLKHTQFLGCGRGVAPLKLPLKAASSIKVVHVLTPMTEAEAGDWRQADGLCRLETVQPVQDAGRAALCRLETVQPCAGYRVQDAAQACEEVRLVVQPAGDTLELSSEGAMPPGPV